MATEQTYRTKMFKLGALAFVAASAAGIAGGQIVKLSPPGQNFWLVFAGLLAVFAVGITAVHPWWRKLDDVQRTGQMVSWYWGGQIGAIIVLAALVAATGTRSDLSLGGLALFLGEAVGFGIFWLIWRFRLRGPAE